MPLIFDPGGTLSAVYGMLRFYGFSATEDGLEMHQDLKNVMLECIKAHKAPLADLQNRGLHPSELMSNAISWEECMALNVFMHGVGSSNNIDPKLAAFDLQCQQGLYRQERAGKTGV